MFTFGVIPTSGVPSASTTAAAWSPLRIQGETQAEACQGCVFAIEEAEAMFGRRKRQPDARPNTAATLYPAPGSTGCGRLEESAPLPIDGLGEDPLLAAEPCRLCDNRGPVDGIVRGTSRKLAPALLGVLHPR